MPKFVGTLLPPTLAAAPTATGGGQLYYDIGVGVLYYWNGASWVALGEPALQTSLPASPPDGQIISYDPNVGADDGVAWRFRYHAASASAYKWEFVGGSPLYSFVATTETRASATFGDLATVGPTVTLPLAGDYLVSFGARQTSSAAATNTFMSYAIGGTAASASDQTQLAYSSANYHGSQMRTQRKNGLTAAVALTAKYAVDGGATGYWIDRWLQVTPIRVG